VATWALKGDWARAVIHGLFWGPFDVAHAITESGQYGFSEDEIDAIGALCGRGPNLTDWHFSMGTRLDVADRPH